jgi:hypothetical protein
VASISRWSWLFAVLLAATGCAGDLRSPAATSAPPVSPLSPTATPGAVIDSFDECVGAGYPVMESYPRQCRTPAGRTFVEELSPEEQEKLNPAPGDQVTDQPQAPAPISPVRPGADDVVQPPYDKKSAPPGLIDKARFDLARRLRINLADIQVIDTEIRPMDAQAMRCVAGGPAAREAGAVPKEVHWIALTAGGQTYSYAGVGGEVIYCGQ